jgi:hypothetical protein
LGPHAVVVHNQEEVTMVGTSFLAEHRTWEDWASIAIGFLIGLTPWLAGQTQDQAIMLNAALTGVLVLALAAFEFVTLRRGQEVAGFACGLWLMASPFVFGYVGLNQLAIWHFALGALVALLASLEFWQDWNLSEEELAKHGQ